MRQKDEDEGSLWKERVLLSPKGLLLMKSILCEGEQDPCIWIASEEGEIVETQYI